MAIDINGNEVDLTNFTKVDPTLINVLNGETGDKFSAPTHYNEDEVRFLHSVQLADKALSDYFGMQPAQNSILSQITRAVIATAYRTPAQLRSVYKGELEERAEFFKTLPKRKLTERERFDFSIRILGQDVKTGRFPILLTEEEIRNSADRNIKMAELMSKKVNELNKQNSDFLTKSKWAKTAQDGFWYDLGSGATTLGAAVAVSMMTRTPHTAAILFGLIQKGEVYEKLRAQGYSATYANKYATMAGLFESGLEFVGLDLFLKSAKNSRFMNRMLFGAITEGTQEASQTIAELAIMQKYGNEGIPLTEAVKDIAYSGMLGALLGGGTSSILGAVEREGKARNLPPEIIEKIKKTVTDDKMLNAMSTILDKQKSALTYPGADEQAAINTFDQTLEKIDEQQTQREKGIKETVKTEIMEAGIDETEAEQVSDIMQARAEAAASVLGISPQEWLESKRLQYKGETPELSLNEAIQEETIIEEIERPTEVLYQAIEKEYIEKDLQPFEIKRKKLTTKELPQEQKIKLEKEYKELHKELDPIEEEFEEKFKKLPIPISKTGSGQEKIDKLTNQIHSATKIILSVTTKKTKAERNILAKQAVNNFLKNKDFDETFKFLDDKQKNILKTKWYKKRRILQQKLDLEYLRSRLNQIKKSEEMYKEQNLSELLEKINKLKSKTAPIAERIYPAEKEIDYTDEWNTFIKKYDAYISVPYELQKVIGELEPKKTVKANVNFINLASKAIDNNYAMGGRISQAWDRGQQPTLGQIDTVIFAYIRHNLTNYDKLFNLGYTKETARDEIEKLVSKAYEKILDEPIKKIDRTKPDILQQPARGQIEFGPDDTVIRLFQSKDRSTLLHETGHLFLRDMQAIADETQDEQTLADMSTIRQWLGVKEGDKFSHENEENFADGFVNYINTGKAPNAKLVNAFERFKQWLLNLYEKVKTRVTLTPEVQQVFDRMLGGYDVETATNIKEEYGAQVTELQTLAENIKAGKLADITQAQLDDFEALINAAKQRPPAEPQSLLQWIRRRGGIWDKGGELRDMDLPVGIIRKSAESAMPDQAFYNTLDSTREIAVEEGFLEDGADINALLDAISKETRGDKTYRQDDLQQVETRERILQDKDEAEIILSQLEINPEEALQTIRKERAKQLKPLEMPEMAAALSRIGRLERAIGRISAEQKQLTEAQIKAITKADIKEVQNRIIDLIKSARLDPKDRAKFISTIKNIQTGEQLARILPKLQERIAAYKEQTQKGKIREQIHTELKKIKPALIAGKVKGKYDAETQEVLQVFKDIEKMTVEKARDDLQQIYEKAREMQYKPSQIEQKQHLWLQIQAYYSTATQAELQEVLDFIKQLKTVARVKIFERMEAEKAEQEQAIATTIKAIDGSKPFDPKSIQEKPKGLFNYFNYWLHDWNTLLQKVLSDKQWSEYLAQQPENAELEEMGYWNTDNRLNKEMLTNAYNVAEIELQPVYARQMDEFKFNIMGSDNVVHPRKLTRGQIIDLYAQAKNEETRALLTDPEINAYSDAELTAIFAVLSKEDISLANALFQRYEAAYEELNATFKETQGIKLPKVKDYIPRTREAVKEDEDLITQVIYQASTTPSAVKRRTGGKSQVKLMNALARLDRHIDEKNRFITHAKMLQKLNGIFRNADVRAKIKGKYGTNTMQAIDAHLKTFGLEKTQDLNTFWAQLRGAFVGLKIGLSPVIFLKQLTSVAAYMEVLSPAELAGGMIDFLKHPVKNAKWLRNNSEFIRNRIDAKAFERDIKAMEKTKLNKLNAFTKWNDFVTMFVTAGDIMAIYPGMWAMLKAGKTMQEAERFSNRTQQSASRSKLSLAQKGTNTDKLFTMFTSTPQQYLRKIIGAWKDWHRGDISTAQLARIQTIYAVILPAIFAAVGSAFRPDKKKKEFTYTMLTSNISGLPFISWVANTLVAEMIKTRTFPYQFPFADEYNDVAKQSIKIMRGEMDKVNWEDFITGVIEASAPFTGVGIPAKRLWNAAEGVYDITAEGKVKKGLLRLGGYTDYTATKATE